MSRIRLWVLLAIVICPRPTVAADGWPEWRGASGQGYSDAVNLPIRWNEKNNVAWKTKVPGHGWSTPVVAKGIVWVTTAIDKLAAKADADRRRKASTNSQPLRISDSVSHRAVGIDLKTGRIVHNYQVLTQREPQMIHRVNTYATPSPIIENDRLYCYYGPSGIACLDVKSGKVLWSNRTLKVKHENGPGSSPVLWQNLLIVHCDGIDQQYIVALNKETGKRAWTVKRSGKLRPDVQLRKSYATSLVAKVNGKPQVISPAADWIYGYEPKSGRELWKLPYGQLGFSNAARPVAGGGLIYTCTGYMKSQLLAIQLDKQTRKPKVVWRHTKQVPNVASVLLAGDKLYFASDNGIASCLAAATGKLYWTKRIGKQFWAAPLYADGRIYFFDRDGATTVIAPEKKFRRLSVNKLDGTLLATAAAVDGSLILRTDRAVYCLRKE